MADEDPGIPPTPAPIPAAFGGNGKARSCDAADVAAAAVGQLLPLFQALPGALASVLAQTPLRIPQHLCATCVTGRLAWETRYGQQLEAARETAASAAGLAPADPRAAMIDPAPFLPEPLRPGAPDGLPGVATAITSVGGTDVCAQHVPGTPQPAGRKPFLIANASLSGAMVAEAARAAAP